jgi:hypothetical protein
MMTTAVRMPRTVPYRDGEVMGVTFAVGPRRGDAPPGAADACRVGDMRRIAAARLCYCGLEAMTDDVMLIVSELVTNAVLHSRTTEISLSMTVRDGFLHITIVDGMPGCAAAKHADDNAESGRGLALVEAVVKENGGNWGTSNAGARTWCTLAVQAEARP